MDARRAGSRTTMNTKGWLFSALGAWVAAVRIRVTVSSSTSSGSEGPGRPLGVHHLEEVGHGGRWYRVPGGRRGGAPDWALPG